MFALFAHSSSKVDVVNAAMFMLAVIIAAGFTVTVEVSLGTAIDLSSVIAAFFGLQKGPLELSLLFAELRETCFLCATNAFVLS